MKTILVAIILFVSWDVGYAIIATIIYAIDARRISQRRAELEREFPGVFNQPERFTETDHGFVKLLPEVDSIKLRRTMGIEVRAAAVALLERKAITSPISDGQLESLLPLLDYLRLHEVKIPRLDNELIPGDNSIKAMLMASASVVHACKEVSKGNMNEAREFLELYFLLQIAILKDNLWISHLLVCAYTMSSIRVIEAILSRCHEDEEMLQFFDRWIPKSDPLEDFRMSVFAESILDLEPKRVWVQPRIRGIAAQRISHCIALFVSNGVLGWRRTAHAFMVKSIESNMDTLRAARNITNSKELLHALHQIGNKQTRWSPYQTTRLNIEHTEAKTFESMLRMATMNSIQRTIVSALRNRLNGSIHVDACVDWLSGVELKVSSSEKEISVQSSEFLDGKTDSLAIGRSTPYLKMQVKLDANFCRSQSN